MKYTILHGDNHVTSRQLLTTVITQHKDKGWEILHLENPDEKTLSDASRAQGLFSQEQLLVVENFLSGQKDGVETVLNLKDTMPILFWEKKTLPPGAVKKLQNVATIQEFKLPNAIFALMDNIYPGNEKKVLILFRQALESKLDAEFIFVMLARQAKLLLSLKLDPESFSGPPWQKGKLLSQANKFTEGGLLNLHAKLLEIDRDSKTSKLTQGNLASSLELLFVSL